MSIYRFASSTDPDLDRHMRAVVKWQVEKRVKETTYNWMPIDYTAHKSLIHLVGRAAPEYAAIYKIFSEISRRHPDFRPRSFFDFGAGVGTGTWAAAALWQKSLYEYYLVDGSADMNELSDKILRDGDINKNRTLKSVYYRQFLPASDDVGVLHYGIDIILASPRLLRCWLTKREMLLHTMRLAFCSANNAMRFVVLEARMIFGVRIREAGGICSM